MSPLNENNNNVETQKGSVRMCEDTQKEKLASTDGRMKKYKQYYE
jgi:hypothetical protein